MKRRRTRVMEHWSIGGLEYKPDFCGLSLELFARTVMNSETVLPKADGTAGKLMPRLNVGVASAASPRRAATISLERRVMSKQ
jgi:hypothetical protein